MFRNAIILIFFLSLFLSPQIFSQVNVSLPDTSIGADEDITISVIVDSLDGFDIMSYDFPLIYDSELMTATNVSTDGTLSEGMDYYLSNVSKPDTVTVGCFNIFNPLQGAEALVNITFHTSANSARSPLIMAIFRFNEGDSETLIKNGTGAVNWAPIPVELSSFDCFLEKQRVNLKWTTLSEKNNYGFAIERTQKQNSSYAKKHMADNWLCKRPRHDF